MTINTSEKSNLNRERTRRWRVRQSQKSCQYQTTDCGTNRRNGCLRGWW